MLFCMHGVQQEKYHKCPKCRKNCEEAGHDLTDSEHEDDSACFWEHPRNIEIRRMTEEEIERLLNKKKRVDHNLKLVA
jgi:hypothetical protein